MNKNIVKRIICATLGAISISIGIAFMTNANIGADPATLLYDTLAENVGLTVGRWVFILGLVMLIVPLIFDRKKIGYTTVFYVLICQYIIDFFIMILPKQDTLLMGIVYVVIGIILVSIGTTLCLAGEVGLTVYDSFCFSISDHFNINYPIVRYATDAIHLVAALLFKGKVQIGTIICLVGFAFSVNLIKKVLYEPVRKVIIK